MSEDMSTETGIVRRGAFGPEAEARIAENKAKNRMAAAIRGTQWSKDLSGEGIYALAEYCRSNGLDPLRHIEVLGGRPYLTATLYEERAAPLIQAGMLIPHEPEMVHVDARLDQLALAGDAWAIEESTKRMRARITHGVPEKAAAAVVFRVTVAATGKTVVGVNWCGGGTRQRDPVGDAEPTKTAITRAGRRAWKQIADAVPQYAAAVPVSEPLAMEIRHAAEVVAAPAAKQLSVTTDPYGEGDAMPDRAAALATARRALAQPDPYGIPDIEVEG
jgi:hypothetical protein